MNPLHIRLNTNGVDCFLDDTTYKLALRLVRSGRVRFSYTHVVTDEIEGIPDAKEALRQTLLERLQTIGEQESSAGFVWGASKWGMSRYGSTPRLKRATERTNWNDILDALASGDFPEDAVDCWVTEDKAHAEQIRSDHPSAAILDCRRLRELLGVLSPP